MKHFVIRVPEELSIYLEALSQQQNIKKSDLINSILEHAIINQNTHCFTNNFESTIKNSVNDLLASFMEEETHIKEETYKNARYNSNLVSNLNPANSKECASETLTDTFEIITKSNMEDTLFDDSDEITEPIISTEKSDTLDDDFFNILPEVTKQMTVEDVNSLSESEFKEKLNDDAFINHLVGLNNDDFENIRIELLALIPLKIRYNKCSGILNAKISQYQMSNSGGNSIW